MALPATTPAKALATLREVGPAEIDRPCGARASSPSFPKCFRGRSASSLAGKALAAGLWALDAVDIRTHATDKHRSVDDTPAGGGPGMVMRADVLARAIDAVAPAGDARPRLLMSPRGVPLTQARVEALARGPGAVILCGRFEGVDERVIEAAASRRSRSATTCCRAARSRPWPCSMPASGCCPASWARRPRARRKALPRACSNTRNTPGRSCGKAVPIPEVLTSGDHAKVAAWRRAEAERLTRERRPDLWAAYLARVGAPKPTRKRPNEKPDPDG